MPVDAERQRAPHAKRGHGGSTCYGQARALREAYADDSQVVPALVDRHYRLALRAGDRQALVDRLAAVGDTDVEDLHTLRQPTLILWGEQDVWIPVAFAHRFHEDIPGSELVLYADAGHVPMEEIPERTARDARAFLLRLVPE